MAQDHLTKTLINAFKKDRVAQAYILTGPRGVGKTTTSVNLCASLSMLGKRVVLVDLDPQGNASTGLGINKNKRYNKNIYSVLSEKSDINDSFHDTIIPGLVIIPSTIDLSASEIELSSIRERETRLLDSIQRIDKDFDYILIDCPPSLGLLTINALTAANEVLVPLQCEFYALEGLTQLLKTIEMVNIKLNPNLTIMGIVLTMFDNRNKLSELVEKDVRGYLKEKVFKTVIPRNVRFSEAPSHGLPVLLYDTQCYGSKAYASLAGEVINLNRRKNES